MKIKCLIIICLASLNLFANENNVIDSLENLIKSQKDTDLIITLNELTWQYRTVSQEKAIEYGNRALEFSINLDFRKGIAQSYNDLGIIYYDKKEYSQAIEFYEKSLKIREVLKDLNGQASLYMKLGIVHESNGDFLKSIDYSQKALSIYEQLGNEYGAAACINNIAVVNLDINNNDESLKYFMKAVEIRKRINDKYNLSGTYVNIANIYLKKKNTEQAISYYLNSLELCREIGDKYYIATNLNNLCSAYINIKDFENAKKVVEESYLIRSELKDYSGLISCLKNMGDIFIKTKKFSQALEKLNEALNISKTIKARTEMPSLYSSFANYYESIGDYVNALNYQKLQALYNDSLLNENMLNKISELQIKYDTEKKDAENQKLLQENKLKELSIETSKKSKQNQLLIFINLLIVIMLTAIFIYYRNKQKHKNELIKSQNLQEKLRFKAVVDSEEKERIRIAKELHDGIGQLLSSAKLNISSLEDNINKDDEYLLQNSLKIIDEAVGEVRSISHNLMPTALMNYGLTEAISELCRRINESKKLQIDFDKENFDSKLLKETEIILYRIIQEIINNMIKHSKADKINIVLSNSDKTLKLYIKDNGVGYNTSEISKSKGIGWQNIYSRVSILNGDISINSQIGKGTEIEIIV